MVHHDDTYPSAQKFSFLRSALKGQALDIIKGIPITDANYKVAIKKLQERYDNKSLVIQSHIRAILDEPQVKACQARELQGLYSNSPYTSRHLKHLVNQLSSGMLGL